MEAQRFEGYSPATRRVLSYDRMVVYTRRQTVRPSPCPLLPVAAPRLGTFRPVAEPVFADAGRTLHVDQIRLAGVRR